jgi:hypothetical protein
MAPSGGAGNSGFDDAAVAGTGVVAGVTGAGAPDPGRKTKAAAIGAPKSATPARATAGLKRVFTAWLR